MFREKSSYYKNPYFLKKKYSEPIKLAIIHSPIREYAFTLREQ